MRSSQTTKLPSPTPAYDITNDALNRRTIEQALSDLRVDVIDVRDKRDSASSLALRRFQFLLMGM